MRNILLVIATIVCLVLSSCNNKPTDLLDISGEWTVQLDSTNIGLEKGWNNSSFEQIIALPGTTDDAGIGTPNTLEPKLEKPQLLHLTRKNSFLGAAWYTREISIPHDWDGKILTLNLERVIWQTDVWIDGEQVDQSENSLIAPHRYDLSAYLKAGATHRLTIRVDNTKKFDISVKNLAHAYTNDTQVIWNGIIGDMSIKATDPIYISDLKIVPDIKNNKALAVLEINNSTGNQEEGEVCLQAILKNSKSEVAVLTKNVKIEKGTSILEFEYEMGDDVKLWSEYTPAVYQLEANLKTAKTQSRVCEDFGMRAFERKGATLTINGNPVFLRGTLESNIFPLEGHPPMRKEGWMKVFKTAKEWGLNHLRFHSWCPPEAAFEVADEMGFYLQIELPLWALTIGEDEGTTEFLRAEADRIKKEYGNHPSFCMWSMGNELEGDMTVLENWVAQLKYEDFRFLYTITSFSFKEGYGVWPQPEDDFFITQWTKKGWVRGQGVFNSESPSFDKNYTKSIEGIEVPLITHEIGQYSVYPNIDEIPKYTGTLLPLNFMAIKNDLEKKGLLYKAKDYTLASGKLAAILYKEEIERAMKTPGISGFQLLDLHDFPGQGTALVGLLDAFWDNKGAVSAEEFRFSCNGVVPLLRFPKAVYGNDENFQATIDLSNYSDSEFKKQEIMWQLTAGKKVIKSGTFDKDLKIGYNSDLETVNIPLNEVKDASKLTLNISLKNTDYQNQWNIWVYPKNEEVSFGNVRYTQSLSEAYKLLAEGKTVLLNPDWRQIKGIEGKFVPVFWSPVHFPKQAASMGILCDPQHKAFDQFPTDMHTDWQWWDLNINSTTMIVDSIQGGTSVVDVIDNFVNNRRLSMIYEGKVGAGKLILASCDLKNSLENRLVAKQMLKSLLNYMNSGAFNPHEIKNPDVLKIILSKENAVKQSATSVY